MDAEKIAKGLTEAQRRVILEMSAGDMVYPLANTAADAQVSFAETRKIVRGFRNDGLAVYGPLYNEDEGRPQGSGTCLTALGLEVREILQENHHAQR